MHTHGVAVAFLVSVRLSNACSVTTANILIRLKVHLSSFFSQEEFLVLDDSLYLKF